MADELTCDDAALSPDTIERMKYVRLPGGGYAKRIVIVTDTPNEITCDEAGAGAHTLQMRGTVKVGEYQYADLVLDVTPP